MMDKIHRGTRAKEVLENEVFIESFEAIEKELIESWKNSPARDEDGREKIWSYLCLLQKVKTHLQSTLETGKLAELELLHKQTLVERAKDGIVSLIG
ncbi:MAG: hypothetical protein KGL39_16745 [Patescibacteria group bacterium]|nr:hypothetical protein [Patescibacteria group bacterium]